MRVAMVVGAPGDAGDLPGDAGVSPGGGDTGGWATMGVRSVRSTATAATARSERDGMSVDDYVMVGSE